MKTFYPIISLVFTFTFICTSSAIAQTPVGAGSVDGQTWTAAGSPYQIGGNITVSNGATLTIEPGVTVEFQGDYSLDVDGRILAQGTETDSILFTALNQTTGWNGIDFHETPTSNDSSIFEYCIFEYGKADVSTDPHDEGGAFVSYSFGKLRFEHCVFVKNSSIEFAGAMMLSDASALVKNCYFANNTAQGRGGAVATYGTSAATSPTFINCVFENNTVSGGTSNLGGAMYLWNTNATIQKCVFSSNDAMGSSGSGGALVFRKSGNSTLDNCIISDNYAEGEAGAINVSGSALTITNSTIENNSTQDNNTGGIQVRDENISSPLPADYDGSLTSRNNTYENNTCQAGAGGALLLSDGATGTSQYDHFTKNDAAQKGGAVTLTGASALDMYSCLLDSNVSVQGCAISLESGSNIDVYNCTFVNNASTSTDENTSLGAGIFTDACNINVQNCLFADNSSVKAHDIFINGTPTGVKVDYCMHSDAFTDAYAYSDGGFAYSSNTNDAENSAPGFTDASSGDFTLSVSSSAINSGDPSTSTATIGTEDLAGNQRIHNTVIDIGAYEYGSVACPGITTTLTSLSFLVGEDADTLAIETDQSDKDSIHISTSSATLLTVSATSDNNTWILQPSSTDKGDVQLYVNASATGSGAPDCSSNTDTISVSVGYMTPEVSEGFPSDIIEAYKDSTVSDTITVIGHSGADLNVTASDEMHKDIVGLVSIEEPGTKSTTAKFIVYIEGVPETAKDGDKYTGKLSLADREHDVLGTYSFRVNINVNTTGIVAKEAVRKLSISPNPVGNNARASFEAPGRGAYTLSIINAQGQYLYSETQTLSAGQNQVSLPVNNLAGGFYLLLITDQDGNSSSLRFIVQ